MKTHFLLPLLALLVPSPVFAEDCLSRGLSGIQLEQCLEKQNPGSVTGSDSEKRLTYPFRVTASGTRPMSKYDPIAKKPVTFIEISSGDGTALTITLGDKKAFNWNKFKPTKESFDILSANVIGWSTADKSYQDVSSMGGMMAGSLFFPPMLLLAPFGAKNVSVAYTHIAYMSDLGEFKTFQLTTIPDVFRDVAALIEDVTGLKAGEARGDDELIEAFSLIEENLVRATSALRKSLVVSNKEKPWCEVIDRVSLPNIYAKYQQLNSRLQEIRTKIGKPVLASVDQKNSDAKWLYWLEKNPKKR